jgi:hypothetical protein
MIKLGDSLTRSPPIGHVHKESPFHAIVKALELESERQHKPALCALACDRWPDASDGTAARSVPDNVRTYLRRAGMADPSQSDRRWPSRLVDTAIDAAARTARSAAKR